MKRTEVIFWALVGTFVLILSMFFISPVREFFQGSLLFLLPFIIFSLLGIVLIFFTIKEKIKGMLKKILILTGASALGFFVFAVLHNLFYGLEVATQQPVFGLLHALFFIISVFICPLGFVIGTVSSSLRKPLKND